MAASAAYTLTVPLVSIVLKEAFGLSSSEAGHACAWAVRALAAAYARRWAIETGFAELKTALRGPGRLLRGRTPDLARQELWAYLAVYQALRTLITRAAARDGIDPGRISFTTARDAAELTLGTAPGDLDEALNSAETEMLGALVPLRPGRILREAPSAAWSEAETSC